MVKSSSTTRKLLIALDAPSVGGGGGGSRDPKEPGNSKITEIRSLLQKAGIEPDSRIVNIISENFKSKHRLINLFKLLKKCTIPLTDSLVELIGSNISKLGSIASLLDFLLEIKIDSKYINLEELLTLSFSTENLISGLRQLSTRSYLDPMSIKLMFKYPDSALELAKLIINLGRRAFSMDSIETKLNQFSKTHISAVLVLLDFALEKNLFYPELLDILFRQVKYTDIIYEGAKKLALENCLSSVYFDVVENNPENANTIAKNILLLSKASLIDYQSKSDLVIVSELGLGEFFFLGYLKNAELLNRETYKIVCQNHSILSKKEVVDIFRQIPLFDTLSKKELIELIDIIKKPDLGESEYDAFMDIINNHQQFPSRFGPSASPSA